MRKLSLLTILALTTTLSACGGGGGGNGHIPTTTLPDTPTTSAEGVAPSSLTTIASSADTSGDIVTYFESLNKPSALSVFSSLSSSSSTTSSCAGKGENCLNSALNYIKKSLIGTSSVDEITPQLQEALELAGYGNDGGDYNDIDNINNWLKDKDNQNRMKIISDRFSAKQETLKDVKFEWDETSNNQPVFMKFKIDDNTQQVTGLVFEFPNNPPTTFNWDAEKNTFVGQEDRFVYKICKDDYCLEHDIDKNVQDLETLKNYFIADSRGPEAESFLNEAFSNLTIDDFLNGKDTGTYTVSKKALFEDMDMNFISYSLKSSTPLKYSDFGITEMNGKLYIDGVHDQNLDSSSKDVFAGGYDIKKIDPSLMKHEDITFTGKAVAGVNYQVAGSDGHIGEKFDGTATLHFEQGKETLITDFSDDGWYKVTVTSNDNMDDYNIKFEGSADEKFAFKKYLDENGETKDFTKYIEDGRVNIGYYGDGVPTEATGYFFYREDLLTPEIDHIEAGIAFGATRK